VLLAELEGRPIGYAILTYGYDLEFGGMDAYLTDLFLAEPDRGRGLGQWLLGEVERASRRRRPGPPPHGRARRTTARHHIYHRAGFHVSRASS
jgi:GNAT superfamily N-acetyltransferase